MRLFCTSRQTQWSHRGREIRERGDDAKTEGTKAVWPRSRESKAASRCWRSVNRCSRENQLLLTSSHWPSKIHSRILTWNHKRISSSCFNHFICGNLLQEHRKWIYCIFILVGQFPSQLSIFIKWCVDFTPGSQGNNTIWALLSVCEPSDRCMWTNC